jgi:hypothetical protein
MSSKNPKILSKNLDYENPYMKIFHEKVEYPNKKQNDYWVLHRRTEFFSIIIPLFPNNETVLVGQFRIPTENYSWEFPMGGVGGFFGGARNAAEVGPKSSVEFVAVFDRPFVFLHRLTYPTA